MALLKAVRVSDVPTLDVVLIPDIDVASAKQQQQRGAGGAGRFAVIGHRGKGMNALSSPDRRLQEVKENSVRSFNEAARFPVDYVEFDVQVKMNRFLPACSVNRSTSNY
jgi:glycerophosphodiester phosphodiesterase